MFIDKHAHAHRKRPPCLRSFCTASFPATNGDGTQINADERGYGDDRGS